MLSINKLKIISILKSVLIVALIALFQTFSTEKLNAANYLNADSYLETVDENYRHYLNKEIDIASGNYILTLGITKKGLALSLYSEQIGLLDLGLKIENEANSKYFRFSNNRCVIYNYQLNYNKDYRVSIVESNDNTEYITLIEFNYINEEAFLDTECQIGLGKDDFPSSTIKSSLNTQLIYRLIFIIAAIFIILEIFILIAIFNKKKKKIVINHHSEFIEGTYQITDDETGN